MRFVFGVLAIAVISAGWVLCPVSVRAEVYRAATPDSEIVSEIRAGAETIWAAVTIRAPELDQDSGEEADRGR